MPIGLDKAMKKHRITNNKLAEAVGVSESFISHIRQGTRFATVDVAVAISKQLNGLVPPKSMIHPARKTRIDIWPETTIDEK
jgi:transcriptional regulator with XRE-family HTH domain